jgi:hypothetical protein
VDGDHRLVQQRPGPHDALVRVAVEPRKQRTVSISPNAFTWLREAYGDGTKEGPGHVDLKQEAAEGASFALVDAGLGGEVTVTEIRYANADTAPGDVRFAAHVVWKALGREPQHPPWIDDKGVHFPKT